MMIRIAPSILSADFGRLEKQIHAVEEGGADMIHCDIMDGHFVPNISFGPMVVEAARKITSLPLDTHLMISNPEQYVKPFHDAGATTLIVHAEATVHLNRLLSQIKKEGMLAGVAINPATSIQVLEEVLTDVDQILVMTVNPGFGGQAFLHSMLDKIHRLKLLCEARGLTPDIEVDGGIDESNAESVVKAGASILVAGSSIFSQKNIPNVVKSLRKKAMQGTAILV